MQGCPLLSVKATGIIMSRSVRSTPKCGITTAASDKTSKRWWSKLYRLRASACVQRGDDPPRIRQVGNRLFEKDGKHLFDPIANPELMRK